MKRAPGAARSAWAARQVRDEPGVRPHLRPLRDRLRVRERRARAEPCAGRSRAAPTACPRRSSARRARASRTTARVLRSPARRRGSSTATDNRPYVQEHTDLIASIRAGKPHQRAEDVAESTLTAIMGRMSAYTGKAVTWEQALNSQEQLMPAGLTLGPLPTPPVAMPGQTPLVCDAGAHGAGLGSGSG